jgi:hypothetical protein
MCSPELHEDVEGGVEHEVDDKDCQQEAGEVPTLLGQFNDLTQTVARQFSRLFPLIKLLFNSTSKKFKSEKSCVPCLDTTTFKWTVS